MRARLEDRNEAPRPVTCVFPETRIPDPHTGFPPAPFVLSAYFPIAGITLTSATLVEIAAASPRLWPAEEVYNSYFNVGLDTGRLLGGWFWKIWYIKV